MRRLIILAILAMVVMALLSAALVFTGAINAKQNTTSSRRQIAALLTRQELNKLHPGALASAANGAALGSGDLVWNGGLVEEHPRVFLIFWGAAWNNGSGGLTADAKLVQTFFTDVSNSPAQTILTQYGDKYLYASISLSVGGIWLDSNNPPVNSTICGGTTVDDLSAQQEIAHAISANGWPHDVNSTYLIYTPSGYFVNEGGGPAFCSEQQFCAYHGMSYTAQTPYAVIPYPTGQAGGGGSAGCMVPTSPNNNLAGDSLVNLSSVEQADATTDPHLDAWNDNAGFEIGDKCAWDFSAGQVTLHNGGTFELQSEYSNRDHACVNSMTYLRPTRHGVSVVTPPGANAPSQTLTLTNTGWFSLAWSEGSLPSWVSVSPSAGSLGAGASQTLTFSFNTAAQQQLFSGSLQLTDPNGQQAGVTIPIQVVQATLAKTWYFAEGYTGSGFSEYLTIANPNAATANVTVIYYLQGPPASTVIKSYQIAPNARFTASVNHEVGANQQVSMTVTADQPIIAERPMYFNYTSLTGVTIPGGSDVLGATQLAQQFDFGYLDTTANHFTWLTILNQNPATMNVSIQYYPQAGGNPIPVTHQIAPSSRGTIYVNGDVPAGTYSALISLDQPGLVERPMYLIDGQTHYSGAADVVGVAQPQTQWNFAEGYISSTFNERYIISNPNPSPATATITFFLSGGGTQQTSVQLPAGGQQIINAGSIVQGNNSAQVSATLPVLAERFMSFTYSGYVGGGQITPIPGASDVLGAGAPSHLFLFAEGYTGGSFGEYLTLENPDPTQTATVIVTFLPSNGQAPQAQSFTVAPNSRSTVFTNGLMAGQSFSMVVTSDVAIVAERPMYFNYYGVTGGSDVIGYQP